MYTIKHVDDGGRERLHEVNSVGFDHKTKELLGYGPTEETIVARCVMGHAYVMNAQGKTVGVYNLQKQEK